MNRLPANFFSIVPGLSAFLLFVGLGPFEFRTVSGVLGLVLHHQPLSLGLYPTLPCCCTRRKDTAENKDQEHARNKMSAVQLFHGNCFLCTS
jgi:hypothetical protein